LKNYLLKDAANLLNINYSTAKTILRIFRIEKRIEKKNAEEERRLKDIIYRFKKERIEDTTKNSVENLQNCYKTGNIMINLTITYQFI
jgi:hypothetical protein